MAELTRTELTVQQISRDWSREPQGRRFAEALSDFIEAPKSPNTKRGYAFSVLQLFEWLRATKDKIPLPNRITKADTSRYMDFLLQSDDTLTEERLKADPTRVFDLFIYQVVKDNPGIRHTALREVLMRQPQFTRTWYDDTGSRFGLICEEKPDGLYRHLSCLVRLQTLRRDPSLQEIRSGLSTLPTEVAQQVGIVYAVEPDWFQYYIWEPPNDERAATALTRIAALSAFWQYLMEPDNTGSDPLIRFNVWKTRSLVSSAMAQNKAARASKTPGIRLFMQLLLPTLVWAYQEAAPAAAFALMHPTRAAMPVPLRDLKMEPLADTRDRFVMLLFAQTGLRVSELRKVKRKHLSDDMILTVMGKGRKKRQLLLPPAVERAFWQLTNKIRYLDARAREERGDDRYSLLLEDKAPLVPAIKFWGANAGLPRAKHLLRSGVAMMLRRRAVQAGIERGSEDFKRIHPHGLRHLFAKHAHESGTPINHLQAILGHASGARTLQYMEEHDPRRLVATGLGRPSVEQPLVAPPPAVPARPEPVELPAGPIPMPDALAGRLQPESPSEVVADTPVQLREPELTETFTEPEPSGYAEELAEDESPLSQLLSGEAEEASGLAALLGDEEDEDEDDLAALLGMDDDEEDLAELLEDVEEGEIKPEQPPDLGLEEAVSFEGIYAYSWGEKGNRTRLKTIQLPQRVAELTPAAEEDPRLVLMRQAVQGREELEKRFGFAEEDGVANLQNVPIGHVYIGKTSRLPWWAGGNAKLEPAMPILSPRQAARCATEDTSDPLCRGIAELWLTWAKSEDPGPTAAAALIKWLQLAINISEAVERQVEEMGGMWISHNVPGEGKALFREHDPEKILDWFRKMAWEYRPRMRLNQTPEVDKIPEWYADADPILSMPPEERLRLLEWLAVLTGQPIQASRSTLIKGTSFRLKDVINFIQALCRLDDINDDLRQARVDKLSYQEIKARERIRDDAAKLVDREAANAGMASITWTSAKEWLSKRIAERRAGEGFRYRKPAYLALVARLFGPEAATNLIVQQAASCEYAPLRVRPTKPGQEPRATTVKGEDPDLDYQQLFRIDWNAETIRHTEDFARRFAQRTGAHSECVARRMARALWNLRQSQQAWDKVQGRSATPRIMKRSEMRHTLSVLSSYLVPCPARYEVELRRYLDYPDRPIPVYETWRREFDRERLEQDDRSAFEQLMDEQDQVYEPDFIPNPGRGRFMDSPWFIAWAIG